MEVVQVLHMNGGDGESSYSHNSHLQKKVLSMTQLMREEAIYKVHNFFPSTTSFAIADLGCSSGPNTLSVIHEFITSFHKIRGECAGNQLPVDIQVFLNDLPGNDFNTVFKAFPRFMTQLKNEVGDGLGCCFVHGVPGSFYDRLFQAQSLHFIHSSYSLHFLSQVPKGLGRSNKSNIYLASSSPKSVIKAYYEQFQTDFTKFLRLRSKELVTGGCMVFTLLGTKSDDPTSKEGSGYIWELLSLALNQMVSEGMIEEEKVDVFNIPKYIPSPKEIEIEVKKEGSFVINGLQVTEIDWDAAVYAANDVVESGDVGVVKCMRAVAESMLAAHFGEGLMDEVFSRYGEILADRMSKERTFFTNITFSLTKTI